MGLGERTDNYSLLTLQMRDLAQPALLVSQSESIQATAAKMTETNSHTSLVVDGGCLCGIATDQNFRARVIARGHDPNAPIASIMTPNPLTLPPNASASEALLIMASHNIRHIPVVDPHNNAIVGVVGGTDLLRSQSHHALYLIGDIHLAKDVATLQRLSLHTPKALVSMMKSLTAYHTTHAISSIGLA